MLYHSTHDRNSDFIRQCLIELKKPGAHYVTALDVIDRALKAPAPCYYADLYRAAAIMRRAMRDGELPGGRYACSQMWRDMFADFRALAARFPGEAVGELVLRLCSGESGNPRFYISRRRALELLKPHIRLMPVA